MNQNVTKAQDKPVLDPESFQRLLAAAFVLQEQNPDPRPPEPIGGAHPRTFAIEAIVQKRTPSLRQPSLHPDRLIPLVQFTRPMVWRTVEALAIAMVFCMMMGVSIRRVSPFRGDPSLPSVMAGRRTAQRSTLPQAKVLPLSQQPVVTLNPRQSTDSGTADAIAEDLVIRHQERAADLRDNPAAKNLTSSPVQGQRLRAENTTLQPGVRFTFGIDTDMLAADTVVRYGTRFAAPRLEGQNKP